MTDNEIIKALECCAKSDCRNCPYLAKSDCTEFISKNVLDLINRKQAKIERLQSDLKEVLEEWERLDDTVTKGAEVCYECHREYDEKIKQVKSEAIKEFAERLCEDRVSNDPVVIAVKVELKEMVGDSNAE